MATVTYVGGETAGLTNGTHWDGVQFPLNVPVEVNNDELVGKAKQHPHFKVSEGGSSRPAPKIMGAAVPLTKDVQTPAAPETKA